MNSFDNKIQFRIDIQILRSIAVLAVIFEHYFKQANIFSEGFLGVDLFFMISGFVIPLSLHKKDIGNFYKSLSTFIKKRIFRILPSLFVCVIISSFFLILFIPTAGKSVRVGISSIFGISNLYLLFSNSNYFSDISNLNAFLHTWSLGIEEQFYLIFSIVYFSFYKKYERNIKLIFFITFFLLTTSYLFAYYFLNNNFNVFFYSPISRSWEFIFGWLIYLLSYRTKFKIKPFFSFLGLFLLIASFNYKISSNYLINIVSVGLGFSLIVISGENNFLNNKNFKILKIFSYIGDLSYSLYLWHWPIYVFIILLSGKNGLNTGIISLIITILISITSHNYLEKPVKSSPNLHIIKFKKLLFYVFISCISISSALAISAKYFKGILFKSNYKLVSGYKGFTKVCSDKRIDNLNLKCVINNNNANNLYLIGDSHALHFANAIKNSIPNKNIIISAHSGTPFPSALLSRNSKKLFDYNLNAYKNQLFAEEYLLDNLKKNDLLIISNYYQVYYGVNNSLNYTENFHHFDPKNNLPISREKALDNWKVSWLKLLNKLKKKDIKIIIIGATPALNNRYTLPEHCLPNYFNRDGSNHSGCLIDISYYKKSFEEVDKFFDKLSSLYPDNLRIIDPSKYICGNIKNKCSVYNSEINASILFDTDHLTIESSYLLMPPLKEIINKLK